MPISLVWRMAEQKHITTESLKRVMSKSQELGQEDETNRDSGAGERARTYFIVLLSRGIFFLKREDPWPTFTDNSLIPLCRKGSHFISK